MLKVLGYYCVFTPLSVWGGAALEGIGWNEYLVLAISMVLNMATEFLFLRYVVYRGKTDNAVKQKTPSGVGESSAEGELPDQPRFDRKISNFPCDHACAPAAAKEPNCLPTIIIYSSSWSNCPIRTYLTAP